MKFLVVTTTILLFSIFNTFGNKLGKNQNSVTAAPSQDETKAIAIAGVNSEGNLNIQILNNLKNVTIPETYFQLNLSDIKISPVNFNQIKPEHISFQEENRLQNWLTKNKAGQNILSQWFNRQPDGSFSTTLLEKSGLIDESVINTINAESANYEEAAGNLANSTLNRTYLVVFDFGNVQTMSEYYKGNSTALQNQILRGYIASVKTYIFKLDFNSSIAEKFISEYFTSTDDATAKAKQEAFDRSEFPFFYVTSREDEIVSAQSKSNQNIAASDIKSDKELLDAMAELAVENITNLIEENRLALSVTKSVTGTKPITSQIGAAQGVKFDQRFGVYENRLTPSGSIKAKRISVVKSMKVADNLDSKKENEDYSAFYKIASGKVKDNGMYLKKKYDTGINLFAGKTTKGLSGNTGRFEYYFSKAMGGAVIPGKKAKGLTSIKLYFEASQSKKSYLFLDESEDFTFTRGSFGIEKEYHPLPFMHWGPFIGYGLEFTTWENSDYLLSTNFAEMGARLGINLHHNIQVIGSATYYNLIKTVLMDDNRDVVDPDFDYTSTFNDRSGWGYSIGLRIML